ncbi:hypothetical protein MBLNU230_g7915t1 [Neophaeotheca triangularis]
MTSLRDRKAIKPTAKRAAIEAAASHPTSPAQGPPKRLRGRPRKDAVSNDNNLDDATATPSKKKMGTSSSKASGKKAGTATSRVFGGKSGRTSGKNTSKATSKGVSTKATKNLTETAPSTAGKTSTTAKVSATGTMSAQPRMRQSTSIASTNTNPNPNAQVAPPKTPSLTVTLDLPSTIPIPIHAASWLLSSETRTQDPHLRALSHSTHICEYGDETLRSNEASVASDKEKDPGDDGKLCLSLDCPRLKDRSLEGLTKHISAVDAVFDAASAKVQVDRLWLGWWEGSGWGYSLGGVEGEEGAMLEEWEGVEEVVEEEEEEEERRVESWGLGGGSWDHGCGGEEDLMFSDEEKEAERAVRSSGKGKGETVDKFPFEAAQQKAAQEEAAQRKKNEQKAAQQTAVEAKSVLEEAAGKRRPDETIYKEVQNKTAEDNLIYEDPIKDLNPKGEQSKSLDAITVPTPQDKTDPEEEKILYESPLETAEREAMDEKIWEFKLKRNYKAEAEEMAAKIEVEDGKWEP